MTHASQPLVSVLLPTFNSVRYVRRALESILRQRAVDEYQVVVVDDCSIDGTPDVVASFDDPRIELVLLNGNKGPGAARNVAIDRARGRWITVIDADDQWHPERLSRLLAVAHREGPSCVLFDEVRWVVERPDGTIVRWRTGNALRHPLDRRRLIPVSTERWLALAPTTKPFFSYELLVRTGARYPDIRFGEDFLFVAELLAPTDAAIAQVPEVLYWYTIRPGSLRSRPGRGSELRRAVALRAADPATPEHIRRGLSSRLARMELDEGLASLKESLRTGHVGRAVADSVATPRLVPLLLWAAVRSARFRALRLRYGLPADQ